MAAAFDDVDADLSPEEADELADVDFSVEPDLSLELDDSELDDGSVVAEPLLELFFDSRLSVR